MASKRQSTSKKIAVDSFGMEDLDQFWDADVVESPFAVSTVSKSSRRKSVSSTVESDEDDDFNYDTSDSITDEDESEVEVETADERDLLRSASSSKVQTPSPVAAAVQPPAKPSAKAAAKVASKSQVKSPAQTPTPSPVAPRASMGSRGKSKRLSAITIDDAEGPADFDMSTDSTLPLEDSISAELPTPVSTPTPAPQPAGGRRASGRPSKGRASLGEQPDDKVKAPAVAVWEGEDSISAELNDSAVSEQGRSTRRGKVSEAPLPTSASTRNSKTSKAADAPAPAPVLAAPVVPVVPVAAAAAPAVRAVDPVVEIASSSAGKFESMSRRRESSASTGTDFDTGGMQDGFDYDNDNGDALDGFDVSGLSPVHPPSSGKGKSQSQSKAQGKKADDRRVSFGADVAGNKKGKGKSRASEVTTPEPHGVVTPRSDRSTLSLGSTPGSHEFTRGRVLNDESFVAGSDEEASSSDEDEEGITDQSGLTDTSYLESIRKRIRDGGEDEARVIFMDEDDGNVRRSSRATKGKKFAFWKGERPIYEKGDIVGFLQADESPLKRPMSKTKKRTVTKGSRTSTAGSKQAGRHSSSAHDADGQDTDEIKSSDDEAFQPNKRVKADPPIKLPSDVSVLNKMDVADKGLMVWKIEDDSVNSTKIICCKDLMSPPTALPITGNRAGKSTAGAFAASYFYTPSVSGVIPSWIAGFVELPPSSIKDEEAVGECTQVFFVGECQDGAVEVGIADPSHEVWRDDKAQRVLVSKGDSFFVPPGNIYRLENHSTVKSCTIFWNIIRPIEQATVSEPVAEMPTAASFKAGRAVLA